MIGLVIVNFGNVVTEFAGIAGSLELFGLNKYYTVPVCAVIVWLIVVKGSTRRWRKCFSLPRFSILTYIVADFSPSRPGLRRSKPPSSPRTRKCSCARITLYGDRRCGHDHCALDAVLPAGSIVEKGVTKRQYNASRLDVVTGCIFTDIVAWFIIVACASTLYVHGYHNISDAKDAAQALHPLAGDYAYILFAMGLFNASLFAASILPLSTAYAVCEGLGFESGVGKRFGEAPVFYWLYTSSSLREPVSSFCRTFHW